MIIYPSMCDSCIRNNNDDTCTTFPDGIPQRYAFGGFPHIDPEVDGQPVWSLRPGAEWMLTQWAGFWNDNAEEGD